MGLDLPRENSDVRIQIAFVDQHVRTAGGSGDEAEKVPVRRIVVDDRVALADVLTVQTAFFGVGGRTVRPGSHQNNNVVRQHALGFQRPEHRVQDTGLTGVGNVRPGHVGHHHHGLAQGRGFVGAGGTDDLSQRRRAYRRGERPGDRRGRVRQRRGRTRHVQDVRTFRHLERHRRDINLDTKIAGHTTSPFSPENAFAPRTRHAL